MRSTLWGTLLVALSFAVPPPFAISVVQTQTGRANDVAITFGGAWGASNHVVAAVTINAGGAQTVDLTGISVTEVVLHERIHTGGNLHGYIFCFAGDGTDTSFTATTSGSAAASVAAVEISGGSCTEDGTSQHEEDATTPYELTTDITTTQSGSFLIALIQSDSVADYTVTGGGTSLPAGSAEIGSVALGQYQIAGAAGAYDATYTSAANETSLLTAAAVQAAGGGAASGAPRLLLLGVGGLLLLLGMAWR